MINLFPFDLYPEPSKPKRVMKYLLVWCRKGKVTVVVDQKDIELTNHQVLTITSGQYHYFTSIENGEGYILEFTFDFFCKDDNDIELIFHNGLFCHFDYNEVIHVPNHDLVEAQLYAIQRELADNPYQSMVSIHSRIKLILIEINRAKIDRGEEVWRPDALFLKFLELVRGNFEHNYSLADFANLLGTTETKLNEQAKLHTGKTAQNVIYGLVASEAKRLLTYQDLTIKEVAFKLGFRDPFYFSNFFKKQTGTSPKAFQENAAT